jgi:hypothetical protein
MHGRLTCMYLPGGPADHTVALGSVEAIALVDLTRSACVRSAFLSDDGGEPDPRGAGVVAMRRTRSTLCCGEANGRVNFRAADTLRVESGFDAHTGALLSMDVLGDVLVTCGCVLRGGGIMARESVLKAYDLRMTGRPYLVQQVPCASPPFAARFVPGFSGTVVIASENGTMQLLDVQSPEQPVLEFFHVPCEAELTSLTVSETGDCVALTDAAGVVHHWAPNAEARASYRGVPAEYVDLPEPLEPAPPVLEYTEAGCLSLCVAAPPGLDAHLTGPAAHQQPLSSWPELSIASVVCGLPPRLPVAENLNAAVGADFILRGRNPEGRRANETPEIVSLDEYAARAGAIAGGDLPGGVDPGEFIFFLWGGGGVVLFCLL